MRFEKLITLLFLFPLINIKAEGEDEKWFDWNASYIGDFGQNFMGGIKKGNTLMGVFSYGATLRTDKIWRGGELHILGMTTHGKGLSTNYTGDIQWISGIENDNYWFFLENLYFHQNFNKGWFTLGLQDLNQDFLVSKWGANFTNSSFGIPSTYPLNFSAPIYPRTGLAFTINYNFKETYSIKLGIFDGNSGSFEDDRYNVKWNINKDEGILTIGELSYTLNNKGQIKAGGMFHSGKFIYPDDTLKTKKGITGYYSIIDYYIIKEETKSVGCFFQASYHPSKANINNLYLGGGLVFQGMLFNRENDYVGIAANYAKFFDNSYECDIECSYSVCIHKHINIMPSLHYIIHPGAYAGLNNSFAGLIKVIFTK